MSDNENLSQLSHPNARNNQQLQQDGVISFGANVSHSNVQNLTNIEHLDNLNITEQHQHQHDHEHHQHSHHHQHITEQHQHDHQHHHEHHHEQHLYGHHHQHNHSEHHQHHQHQHLHVSQTVNNSNTITPVALHDTGKFNEAKFREYFRKTKPTYADMFRKGRPITEDMYVNTPILLKSTFEELKTNRANQENQKRPGKQEGTTKISEAFPIFGEEESANRLFAVIGEAGAGKSVYLKTLQSYYIKEGFFVFLLDFSKLALVKDNMPFSNMLKNSCPNFLFDDSNTFDVWLNENEKRCLILLDGLDMAPFLVKDVPRVNVTSSATISTWISNLFAGEIMKDSKIIFSSRPSSVHQLSIPHRPDVLYSLNGFSDESVGRVISNYNNEHKDEIANYIKNKGLNVVNYARNPFVLSMISLIYKNSSPSISSETTLTELYTLAFKQLRCSTHNRRNRRDNKTEQLVDQFFYQLFKEGKISFTEEDVLKHDLTTEMLENFSWINISSISTSDLIEPNEKIITPIHQSLMEYQISRHLMRTMAVPEFKSLMQTHMYKLEEQDRWSMIRRFTSGLVNTDEYNKRKCEIFLKQFATDLKSWTSEDLVEKYSSRSREIDQASLLQANLYNDLVELGQKLNFIKKSFVGASNVNLQVLMKDANSIEGPIFFLKHVDPKLNRLIISFSDDLERTYFTRFATAIDNLSNKIRTIQIRTITPFEGHVKELCRIFNKTDAILGLLYSKRVGDHDIEVIKNKLKLHIDHKEDTKTFIILTHRHRHHLIRHPSYTTMASSGIKPSHLGLEKLTINLNAIVNDRIFEHVENMVKFSLWDFIISHEREVKKLVELLRRVKSLLIPDIHIFISSDIHWICMRMFCKTINKMEHKVHHIFLYNLTRYAIGCDEILLLISQVESVLRLRYSEVITEVELMEWENKLGPFGKLISPNLDLLIQFENLEIRRLPHSTVLEIMGVPSE